MGLRAYSTIFSRFEAAKFRRDDDTAPDEDVARYENCDLLILDDLGTEMTTTFVQSALYQLINGRLMAGKKTIISTNLNPEEIGRRYSPQVRSRLGAAEGAVGLPTATWSLENWSVEEYNDMFAKIVDGTITIDADFNKLASTEHVALNII